MNWKGIAGALVTTALTACVDSVPPVAPDHPNVMPALISVAQAKPLSYVPEVPNGSAFYRPIHMADMDGDGRPEILIGSWSTDRIEIWKYDAAQKKALLVQQTPAFPYDIHGLSTGDMDGDGDLDILAAIRGYGVFLALNNGAGSWTVSNLYPTYAWNTQVADIDRDGHLDVFASLNGGAVVLLYGAGDGTFTAVAGPAFGLTMSINLADFNNDGLPDLIGPDMVLGRMMAYQNLGGRAWSANLGPSDYYPHQLRSEYTPSAIDLYGNGNLTQIAAYFFADSYVPPMSVVLFEGTGAPLSPSWTPRILDVLSYNGFPLGGADLDDDGNLDVFVGGSTGALGFRVYRGDGLGDFTGETVGYTFGVGHRYSFAVTDFNGDGTSDIVAARHMLGVDEPGYGFVILYRVPVYSCQGFEAPLNAGPVALKGKRLLPFRADVLGENGLPLDGSAVATPPLVQVIFVPAGSGTPVDISTGDAFAYIDGKWRFDVRGGDYTTLGSYTVSMLTGNGSEYLIQPTCEATFVVK